jgi:hypothetical protein
MWEDGFRELIGAWAEILDMDPEARKVRLLRLAHAIVEDKLANGDPRTSLFIQREYRRNRDPVVTLAKGFSQLVDREQAKADRERERLQAEAATTPAEPAPAASPLSAALAAAEAARKLRGTIDPQDSAMWRKAGELRREMFDEQVLHHAVVRKADLDRRLGPPSVLHPAEPSVEAGFADEPEPPEPAFAEPDPLPPEPEAPEETEEREETDEEFAARAAAVFAATLSHARPELRAILATFSQEQLWALAAEAGDDGPSPEAVGAQPQGP